MQSRTALSTSSTARLWKRSRRSRGLKEQVDELRKLNYQIQAEGDDINLYDAIDDIDSKMDELCRIPEVNRFLEAELTLCRQLQSIDASIHQGIQLDIPDL